ncbi:enhancer of mRNA-decapping protein 3 isoform X2 [Anthonomus grandis grandis]|uniref:enhancer of mRNA-decapping protein 3 isoform X2 n=1 Tax=Anthonomus grandis grandis TaxID=2921223 RepID=UPI002165A530|nr:enhancer of mRNA-decapping protein 3 isoform X2 [Anthonomus grandis grandis]
MAHAIGYIVSIKCLGRLGIYQGKITDANHHTITLAQAFHNGYPCNGPVQITASDILDISFIERAVEEQQENSIVTIEKPIAKRLGRSHSTSETQPSSSKQAQQNGGYYNKSKPIDIDLSKKFDEALPGSFKNNTPNRKGQKGGKQWIKGWKDEECFGSPLDQHMKGDFDFEKNLALFDKQAIWDELNSQRPDLVRNVETRKKYSVFYWSSKYRHDENVIATQPTSTRQIIVPKHEFTEYVTDDGLIIPCISKHLRKKLFEAAETAGLTFERRSELFGTAAAEIAIQLLGGGHRLNPNNMHQLPTVLVLCGPHRQGAAGVNTARQLASHGVRTIVYCASLDAVALKKELSLYMLTRNRTISIIPELPSSADLIICALCDDSDMPKSYPMLAEWVNKNKAPVLALDPPSGGVPGILAKISLLPVLPLSHSSSNGKLYLANLGFPVDIFNEVGIKYRSPFGAKNTIPLHPNE